MKVVMFLLSLVFYTSCSANNDSQAVNEQGKIIQENFLITALEFKEMMNKKEVVILDVRTPQEVAEGVIGNAVVINYRDQDFKERILKLDKSKTYLVYCKAGGRSGQTKSLMDTNGFKPVYDLDGGITAWNAAGLPLE